MRVTRDTENQSGIVKFFKGAGITLATGVVVAGGIYCAVKYIHGDNVANFMQGDSHKEQTDENQNPGSKPGGSGQNPGGNNDPNRGDDIDPSTSMSFPNFDGWEISR